MTLPLLIGSGGFGITYMAQDFRLKTTVAVKEYFPEQFGIRTPDQSVTLWIGIQY